MNTKSIFQRFPIACYFILAYFISWTGAFIIVSPKLFSGQAIPKTDGLLMFPVMIVGVAVTGVILTWLIEGKEGLRHLISRLFKWKISIRWYILAIIIPPVLILLTLIILKAFVSASFKPNFYLMGILFGIPAGFFEEIGWTGFAIYKMSLARGKITIGIIVGLLWGLWHFPVIDFLGVATPHGNYLFLFFISFILLLTAMRLLMVWVYSFTKSILIIQLMHAIFTGSLVVLGPLRVTPAQETLWYASYAVLLWFTVIIIYFLSNRIKVKVRRVYLQ